MTDTDALDLDAWKAVLARWAKGLNLDEDLDRDAFRDRVDHGTTATRMTLLDEVHHALTGGAAYVPSSREDLVRRIADAWISLSTTQARKPSRPSDDPRVRAAVIGELRACAGEFRAAAVVTALLPESESSLGQAYAAAADRLDDRADDWAVRAESGDDR